MQADLKTSIFFNISKELELLELPISILMFLGENYKNWFHRLMESHGFLGQSIIKGDVDSRAIIGENVYISEGAKVEPYAMINGPCFLAPGAVVRHAAYLRGYVYAAKGAVIGHTTEVKESFFFPEAKAAHFAYIGNSVLGSHVNLGAGVKIANLKLRKDIVSITHPELNKPQSTGLKKMGAIIGDNVQIGCNAVLSPGSLLLPGTGVFPTKHFHGTLKSGFFKS